MTLKRLLTGCILLTALADPKSVNGQNSPIPSETTVRPATSAITKAIEPDGTVNVPGYRLPPSVYLSPEAGASLPRESGDFGGQLEALVKSGRVPQMRVAMAAASKAEIEALSRKYQVTTRRVVIEGVQGTWARPSNPKSRMRRVLINLPGGAFLFANSDAGGMREAIPLAGLGDFDVLSLTYAQAPETTFPAANIDVTKVYRTLLKSHRPSRIGIYGTSAGGLLTAQVLAWLQKEGLPAPAAAGIFAASADARWGGDSWFWQKPVAGSTAPPTLDERFYYGGHDLDDPLISPISSNEVLRKFPPTLLLTATRAGEMSAAVNTHRLLVRNGVKSDLHVWDGLGHGFFKNDTLPETREAVDVMVRFFSAHLGQSKAQ